jgi:hypothetical protein
MPRELIWAALDHPGYEHVRVDEGHPEWTVCGSMLIREDEGNVRRDGYTLIVDKLWRTLELRLMVEEAPGQMEALHLLASGDGTWTDVDGNRIPQLDGCIDVAIQWSPLTNMLPIRRLHLQPGEEREIRVAYVALPDLNVQTVTQRYTAIEEHQIRYTSLSSGFQGELTIDNEGFVVDYPGRFRRAWPALPR